MSHAAIRATFCNLKNVQTRKIVQIICEVPVEQASQVLDVLGWPEPADPKWVVICMLNEDIISGKEPALYRVNENGAP